jgi:hypothetical protein
MKTRTKIGIATSVAVMGGVAFIGTSMARGGFHHGPFGARGGAAMIVEQLDTDQDQRLTRTEIDNGIQSRFTGADTDGDGNLSLEEFQPLLVEIMRPKIVDGFQFLDADGDGVITQEEVQRPVNRIVSHLDQNEDGELTTDEMRKRHRGWGHGRDGGDGRHGERHDGNSDDN